MSGPIAAAIPADTIQRQRRASDPAASAWVSANAGSGKTFVLTRRVVRLLLEGVPPSRILCLTFTKAAAAQMSNRVFEVLAKWVMMEDAALTAAILDTGAARPDAVGLAQARRLFARTVESPGGLKILTIHAFCERILHSFPFEANVPARFSVIDDIEGADMLARAQEAMLARAVARPQTRLGRAVTALGGTMAASTFAELVGEVTAKAEEVRACLGATRGLDGFERRLAEMLGVAGQTVASIERAMVEGGLPPSEWSSIAQALLETGKAPVADRLLDAARAGERDRLDLYLSAFLTQSLEPRKTLTAKALQKDHPGLCAQLDAERDRLVDLVIRRRAAETVERTVALITIGEAVIGHYDALKRARGALDFADLIERSRILLARAGSAWVLFKLDQGIDHILVDEAQDTSPGQWEILGAISRDFFAGDGRPGPVRTFFAVGDEKQSIYSFQGARPAMFEETRRLYDKLAREAERALDHVRLLLSFRSAATVLDFVDRVFAHPDNARGLTATREPPEKHQAQKAGMPGLVEIWPPVHPAPDLAQPEDWQLPLDALEASDPAAILAARISERIRAMTAPGSGETVEIAPGKGRRPVRAGDILILVRSRNAFFNAIIRALKERLVPVAGADRLSLTDHIAVMDLIAAGRTALLRDDDFTLACALKSPLFGFDDDDLLDLAPERPGSLAAALDASAAPRHRAAATKLAIWRDRATQLSPFAFYTRMLGQDGGRKALLERLGPEAGDVIDEFMALTLAHERDGAPSLLAFLARLEGADLSVKRDMEQAGDAVRVMTVHAAKGLEAKIVFVPDTCSAPSGRHDPKLFRLEEAEGGLIAWSSRSDADPALVGRSRTAGRDAAADEHRRLLYVALTRAEERLYIAGFCGVRGPAADCWHDMIMAADLDMSQMPAPWNADEIILRRADPMPPGDEAERTRAAPLSTPLPDWIHRAAPREDAVVPPVRPSNVLGAADRFDSVEPAPDSELRGMERREAARLGRLHHRLLQHLPGVEPARRRDAARRFLLAQASAMEEGQREGLIETALAVLGASALAALFGPGSQAEVPLAANLVRPEGGRIAITGQIDRIAVTADEILIADFKTGRPRAAEATPESYLTQLALYRAAVQALYPDRPVRTLLVWTAGPQVVELAPAQLDAALSRSWATTAA